MRQGSGYTVFFAAAVCGVFSVAVSFSAVSLKTRQAANQLLDRQKNVLEVTGLLAPEADLSRSEIKNLYDENIETRIIDLTTGAYVTDVDPESFDQRKASADTAQSRPAPENPAQVQRLPNQGLVYLLKKQGVLDSLVIPIEGKGLWSTLYGYLALDRDTTTIRGITFFQHAETPGLGGEVDNPGWKTRWVGRKAFDEAGVPRLEVIKGPAGPPGQDPFRVDGLSGATITARGVSHLVQFWLGESGYGPFLKNFRQDGGE